MDIFETIRDLFKEPDVKYISLKYCDDYNSLNQSIMVNKLDFIESNERALSYLLLRINPNLHILHSITLYDKAQFPIKIIYYDKSGNVTNSINMKEGQNYD